MFKKIKACVPAVALVSTLLVAPTSSAQEPFLGEISWFAGNFAPRGWAFCDGQSLAISSNTALFSILGTTYGGDGRTTFALPDMRGRMPVHDGNGPGLSQRRLGQKSGTETVALTAAEMPSHSHTAMASSASGSLNTPEGNVLAGIRRGYDDSANVAMDASAIANNGGGQAHNNMPPFQVLNCIIATQGIFPSRS